MSVTHDRAHRPCESRSGGASGRTRSLPGSGIASRKSVPRRAWIASHLIQALAPALHRPTVLIDSCTTGPVAAAKNAALASKKKLDSVVHSTFRLGWLNVTSNQIHVACTDRQSTLWNPPRLSALSGTRQKDRGSRRMSLWPATVVHGESRALQ